MYDIWEVYPQFYGNLHFMSFMFLLHMIKWLCCYVQNVDEVMYVTELCIEEIGNEKNGYHISLLGWWGSKYVVKKLR